MAGLCCDHVHRNSTLVLFHQAGVELLTDELLNDELLNDELLNDELLNDPA
jgi:hypothetical protein